MIKTTDSHIVRQEIQSVTCDRCNKSWTPVDFIEYQEAHYINFTGGYGSLFGDMSKVTCDLCQNCLYDLIKLYCYVDGERLFQDHKEDSDESHP